MRSYFSVFNPSVWKADSTKERFLNAYIPLSKEKKSSEDTKEKQSNTSENTEDNEDEFNPTLAAMELEIKPKVLQTVSQLCRDYNKLIT